VVQLSPPALVRLLRAFGFSGPIEAVPAMCLGTPVISLAEMISAYTVFTQHGLRIDPLYVTHIEDQFGNTIESFSPLTNEVLPEDAACKILTMLKGVVDGGTANSLRWTWGFKAELGGKTGTTQEHSDGWYIGFSPSLVAGCWVGGDDRYIHFESMAQGQGARVALPVYAQFMKKVYADKNLEYSEDEKFDIPEEYQDPCAKNVRNNDNPDRSRPVNEDFFK
jgi:penicillin-binding protein 1A